jgi:hypothetical protein
VLSLWTFQISRSAGGDETPLEDFSDLKKKKKKKDIPLDLVCLILPQENVTYTS